MNNKRIFTIGEIWKYNNRPGEAESTLTILDVEPYETEIVVHIRIDGITMALPNGTMANHIKHFPFSAFALSSSITRLIGHAPRFTSFFRRKWPLEKCF